MGALTTVVQANATFINNSISDHDAFKPITSKIFGDINSLYPTVMNIRN